jgi:hypothetical protein
MTCGIDCDYLRSHVKQTVPKRDWCFCHIWILLSTQFVCYQPYGVCCGGYLKQLPENIKTKFTHISIYKKKGIRPSLEACFKGQSNLEHILLRSLVFFPATQEPVVRDVYNFLA